MTKALSIDLRERVVAVIDGGLSLRQGGGAVRGQRVERDSCCKSVPTTFSPAAMTQTELSKSRWELLRVGVS